MFIVNILRVYSRITADMLGFVSKTNAAWQVSSNRSIIHSSKATKYNCFYSRYGAAEADCTTSISLDPTYVKAYSRRGTARVKLNKLQEARKDFTHVLKLEPRNKQVTEPVADRLPHPPHKRRARVRFSVRAEMLSMSP